MKNGDARSPTWIARAMKEYRRDNERVQTALMLVSIDPTPSLDEIRSWSKDQCLLAEDWAFNHHLSASDNNNRVPACPEFLKPYQRNYPARTAAQAARDVVRAMGDDNCMCYHPTARQLASLEVGIALMQKAGCFFTDAEIQLFGAGEHTEMLAHFQRLDGFDVAQKAMVAIFDEVGDYGEAKTDGQRAADKRRWHA
jgi:hypothetical protein